MAPRPLLDVGAGITTKPAATRDHPAGPIQHGTAGQVQRAFTAASTFFSGMLAINASQFLGAPLKAIDPKFYDAYMAYTKQSFGVLITTMTQWWSPTVVRVSGDKSIPGQLFRKEDGSLQCKFPKRLVLMANHQLYTDWLYLWWVAYTNNMHGYIYIILKESLKNVPLIGWGAQFYNFIFLSRNWETDKKQFGEALDNLNNPEDPMWLLIFPEGTNLAQSTRERSRAWAEKTGVQDMKHQLLPRSRGIQFSLQRLKSSTEWLYDCTIGYEGIPPGEFGQDIFTLRSSMFEGRPPKSVNMHFRRFKISSIPIHDDAAFDVWLRNRWREKDYLLEHFTRFNRFPDDIDWMVKQRRKGRKQLIAQPAKSIETQIKSNNLEEFLSIFAPLTSVMTVISMANGGASPSDVMQMFGQTGDQGKEIMKLLGGDTFPEEAMKMLQAGLGNAPNAVSMSEIGKLTPEAGQQDLINKYLSSIRPAAAKQIALPERALRATNLPANKATATSIKSLPAPKAKVAPGKKNVAQKAPSIVSAPVAKAPPAAHQTGPAPNRQPAKAHDRNRSLHRTIHPESSVSKVTAMPSRKAPPRKPEKSVAPPVVSTPDGRKKSSPTTRTQHLNKASSRPISIDPQMLARMQPKKTGPQGPRKVTIDAAVLARMRAADTKSPSKGVAPQTKASQK